MSQKPITSFFKKINVDGEHINNFTDIIANTKIQRIKRKCSDIVSIDENSEKNIKHLKLDRSIAVDNISTNEFKEKKRDFLNNGSKFQKSILDLSGISYDPSKSEYHPINDAFWKMGEPTPYLALTRTFQLIEEIRGRLKMVQILSNFFRSVIILSPNDLLACVYLSLNQLAPANEGLELGVAESSLIRAIYISTGQSVAYIKSQLDTIGDLGVVAEQARSSQCLMYHPAPLTVCGVFEKLKNIAKMSGQSVMNRKIEIIQGIFVACRHSEARFFIRSLLGKLRIGIAEQSLMKALAIAVSNCSPTQKNGPATTRCEPQSKSESVLKNDVEQNELILKTTFCQCPNYDRILPILLQHGITNLIRCCPMKPGTPIKPMLAQPTKGVQEVFTRFEGLRFTCEWKYDGERAQIHRDELGNISIFSRNQENNTSKYPDIISQIENAHKKGIKSYIIDTEVVAWDIQSKQILPFQILSTRKRKNVDKTEIRVQVCVFMFDLLYINGSSLVTKNFMERRQLLKENFNEVFGQFHFATACDTSDIDDVQQFLEESIKGNCEGLMIKTLEKNANYEIAKRSRNWLKLKKDYLTGVGDSLDLVVIGGYKGKGKRAGVYGCFLLATYDLINEEYQSICKIGTGFSDEDLRIHSVNLKNHVINSSKSYYHYDCSLSADVWFEPVQVWEVKCADLSLSPVHKAGIGVVDVEKGISLRFPRFIRIRDDKSPEDSTSSQQVVDMYLSQNQIKNQRNGLVKNEMESEYY